MNEVIKAIKERRSIRRFKPEKPDDELIDQVIEAGLYAPSARNLQNTIILKIVDPEIREMFRKANARIWDRDIDGDPFYGAPVILAVLGDANNRNTPCDGALVMGNMMLAAHALGLGSLWVNRCREEFDEEEFKQLLKRYGIEGEWTGVGHCALGYIDGEVVQNHQIKEGRVYTL